MSMLTPDRLPRGTVVRIMESWGRDLPPCPVRGSVLDICAAGDSQWWAYDLGGSALVPGWQIEPTGERVDLLAGHCAAHGHVLWWLAGGPAEARTCPKSGCTQIVEWRQPEAE